MMFVIDIIDGYDLSNEVVDYQWIPTKSVLAVHLIF